MGLNCTLQRHTAESVHRVGLAVACMACRGMTDGDEGQAQRMASKILEFVREAGIEDALDEEEMRLLRSRSGSWSQVERVQASWLVEGVGVLAWTLDQAELPKFDAKCQAVGVSLSLGLFQPGVRDEIGLWSTRRQEEIATGAAYYFALHWRLQRYLVKPEKMDLAGALRDSKWPQPVLDGLDLAVGDLTIDGGPLEEVRRERLGEVFCIVRERCKAFRWLTGYDRSYPTVMRVH